jgi:hypothetical protein
MFDGAILSTGLREIGNHLEGFSFGSLFFIIRMHNY